jgi:hypothetical protein
MNAISPEDEFLIQATGPGMEDRSWTRSTLAVAQHIADQAITKLGYAYVEVRNTFGGHISDPLYKVEKIARPPGEPTNEMRLSMKRAGIDPDEWLKKARAPQPNIAALIRK